MKKIILSLALCAAFPAFAQTAFTVNGQLVTAAEQKDLMEVLASQGVKDAKKQEEAAKNILIKERVIGQQARKDKINLDPLVKAKLAENEFQIYSQELIRRNAAAHPISEKQLKETYDEMKRQYNPNEISVRHILVKTEGEANDLITQIKNGADMAALAKEKSLDTAAAQNGGEIPLTNIRSFIIPGFAEAAIGLKKGDILSIPFHSALGYHVIRLEDKREVPFPELDKIKSQVENAAARKNATEYLNGLFKSAKIETVESKAAIPQKKAVKQ